MRRLGQMLRWCMRYWMPLAILFAVGCVGYAFLEPHWLRVHRINFTHRDVPPGWDGATVAFLSDIHHGPFFSIERVRTVVELTNALTPDLILLGGDYVHREPIYIAPCFEELARLSAPLGVYGVLGNHDHWEDAAETRRQTERVGINLLENRAYWIERNGSRIRVGGVGDLWEDRQDVQATLGGTSDSDFVLLVSHNPDFAEKLKSDGIDLMLAGHTHGGQCSLFGLWAPLVPSNYGQKYRRGWVEGPHVREYVSTGIGTITPPVRFCVRPEIVLFTLSRDRSRESSSSPRP